MFEHFVFCWYQTMKFCPFWNLDNTLNCHAQKLQVFSVVYVNLVCSPISTAECQQSSAGILV